jgi:hypothetical protein
MQFSQFYNNPHRSMADDITFSVCLIRNTFWKTHLENYVSVGPSLTSQFSKFEIRKLILLITYVYSRRKILEL